MGRRIGRERYELGRRLGGAAETAGRVAGPAVLETVEAAERVGAARRTDEKKRVVLFPLGAPSGAVIPMFS